MSKVKDKRYQTVKMYIDAGAIKSFQDIFDILPKSILSRDLRLNYSRLVKRVHNPNLFTLREIRQMAELIEVDGLVVYRLIDSFFKRKK
ncbi:MAG: hypothetical protein P0Y53_16850 [Candidatus Pseudobacter hemicellulosilyticus]|uniref:Uncharacterized protein n=1 Tax=Candidatus Pseudobacter hemicellulosilyticus TaxID=3121375 RepID=A0AAJ6BFX0_9BACT|nr:MAG: hypothetical protein P0Y53_16850 [Pseudobacter sp.]